MKHFKLAAALLFVFLTGALGAQSLRGMSFNGATGLYSIPTGRTGWEQTSDFGIDAGYHALIRDGMATHIPKINLSILKWMELGAAFDLQPDRNFTHEEGTDFIAGMKLQLPLTKTAIALGGNFQSMNIDNNGENHSLGGQVYAAFTYAGHFFDTPAETTVVIGKTFRENSSDWNVDFGMGFDMIILPKVFETYLHWITDFSNFSYSVEPFGADSWYRGVISTGLRVDLTVIPAFRKLKFAVDILMTDALDDNRSFSVGAVLGVPVL